MPDLEGSILLLEDDEEIYPFHIDGLLQALIHQPGSEAVRGLVVGKFQRASGIERFVGSFGMRVVGGFILPLPF
jgi:muramoyltetrapeptide carboxypeptidase